MNRARWRSAALPTSATELRPPAPTLQIEGRGNGIKTNVVNNAEIAKALERPPDCEPLLFLGACKLPAGWEQCWGAGGVCVFAVCELERPPELLCSGRRG